MSLIEIAGLRKRFGETIVLDGVDLSIDAGETIALIGPSGGGKSTLLRCINGLSTFDEGRVRVGDHETLANKTHVAEIRRVVGMVFQDFQLFPHMTALENVIEAPMKVLKQSASVAREKAAALLERVGLSARANAYPHELSGGQKQRVAIARALAMEPKALLCDEITSALDPELKAEVLAVVDGLRKDGMTLVMVTHEIGFARRAADRVAVLAEGRVIEIGAAREVLESPRHDRTRRFLEDVMA